MLIKKPRKKHLFTILFGAATGFINGLLGAGGGMLAVPALKYNGLHTKAAHSTSVAVIWPLSLFSAIMYISSDAVKFSDALPFIPWGLGGAVTGTLFLKKISDKWITRIFSAFMVWAGIRLLLK